MQGPSQPQERENQLTRTNSLVQLTLKQYTCFMSDFMGCDLDDDGFLDRSEVVKMLKVQLSRPPSDPEITAMMRMLDSQSSGQISFSDYVRALCGGNMYEVLQDAAPRASANQVLDAVAERILAYGISEAQLRKLFPRSDPQGTGVLSRAELSHCFSFIGIYLSNSELKRVSSAGEHDSTVDGVQYQQVVEQLLEATNKISRDHHKTRLLRNTGMMLGQNVKTKLIRNLVREKIAIYCATQEGQCARVTLEQLFHESDESNSGTLDESDLLNVFALIKIKISWQDLEQQLFKADKNSTGSIDLPQFIKFCLSSKGNHTMCCVSGCKQPLDCHMKENHSIEATVQSPQVVIGIMRDFEQQQSLINKVKRALTISVVHNEQMKLHHEFSAAEIAQLVSDTFNKPFDVKQLLQIAPEETSLTMADWIDLLDGFAAHRSDERLSQKLEGKLDDLQEKLRNSKFKEAEDVQATTDLLNQFLYTTAGAPERYGDMQASFEEADQDKNGTISINEVYGKFKRMGLDLSPSTAMKVFAQFDVNHDGRLSYDEFFNAFSANDQSANLF